MVKGYISEIDRLYFIAINYCFLKPHSKKSLLSGASQLLTFLLERFNNFKCPNKNSNLKWRVIFHYEDFLFKVIILCLLNSFFLSGLPSQRYLNVDLFLTSPSSDTQEIVSTLPLPKNLLPLLSSPSSSSSSLTWVSKLSR